MKILLLEDYTSDTELIQRFLQKSFSFCTVNSVTTLKDARAVLAKEHNFDVALLDVNVPDGSGLELLLEIKGKKKAPIVIVLTGSSDEELAVTALKSGADDFVVKKLEFLTKLHESILFHTSFIKKQEKNLLLAKIKVLYVEHHKTDIDLTIRHFKKYAPHFIIEPCENAQKALEMILKNKEAFLEQYQILLVDYHLPGLDGLLLTKKLRQEFNLNIPIVIITGHGDEEVAIQALKLGADDYMVKRENYIFRLPSLMQNVYQHWLLKQQQKALEKSHEEYKMFFEDDVTGDFIASVDGYLLNCNPAYLKILGFKTIDEARAYELNKLYKKSGHRDEIIQQIQKLGKLVEYELDIINASGKTVHILANIIGVFDDHKKLQCIKGYFIDNTVRKIAVDELRKLSQAIEQSPASILITNLKGEIEYVNPKYCRNSGYSFEEVLGKNPNIVKSGKTTPDDYATLWHTIQNGNTWNGEFLNKRKDGTTYWEYAFISGIKDSNDNITHYLSVQEDISNLKSVQFELIAAKEKAEESDRLKTAFLHNISHEIRTPMNAIMGFSDLLNNPDLSIEKRTKFTDIITKSSQQLLSIIDDIVRIATIEAGQEKNHIKTLNLIEILNHLYESFSLKAIAKKNQLVLKVPTGQNEFLIQTDETKLTQILSNLLSNALKFTKEGTITFGYKLQKDTVEFFVKDTGIGIAPEMHQDIFKRFRQVETSVTRQFGGSGLGLSISKAYVELLGGTIWLQSVLNKGSEFYFTLPINDDIQKSNEDLTNINQNIPIVKQTKTILIAEDEETNFILIQELLSKLNYHILWVNNGLKAVEICKKNELIDLVLMDIKMPVLNGLEATKQIKAFRPQLPIIAQTAYTTDTDAQKAILYGCDDFISKPFKKDELISMINSHFLT